MNVLPIYLATIADAGDGVYSMSLVDYPATEVNWVTFAEDKQIQHFSIQDEEQHLLCGAVMLADTNIYRRDGDYEYYIRYDKETIKAMAEKMLSDKTFNQIDLMHDGEIIPEGTVNLVELFIKDEAKGLNPTYLENIPDGSLLCTYKVNDEELWSLCKDGTFQGFSLSGYFTPKLIKNKEQKNIKTVMNKIKQLLAKALLQMGAVQTDKGILMWEGNEDLKEGDIVTKEDGNAVEDGDYKTEDGKVITIEDGKVAKIEDAEAEVEPDEPKSEEFSKKEAFDKVKAQFEATYQEVQNNIYSALSEAGICGYIVENTNEYAVVSVWGADDLEHLYRYSISIDENGYVTLGEMIEVEVKYEPKADEPAEEPKAEEFAEEEPAADEPAEEPKPEFDAQAEIEALKAEIEEIKKALADIVEKPAEEPIVEQFEKVTIDETISPKLAKAIKRVSTLRKN